MRFGQNMSIRTKIMAAFGAVLLALIGTGALSLMQMSSLAAISDSLTSDWLPASDKAAKLKNAVQEFRIYEARLLFSIISQAPDIAANETALKAADDAVNAAYRDFQPLIAPGSEHDAADEVLCRGLGRVPRLGRPDHRNSPRRRNGQSNPEFQSP